MVSFKHFFYALAIMVPLLNGQFIKSSELSELQARKYINHLLDSLFIPHNHPISYQQHLHNFAQELTNDLTRNLGEFPHFYSFSKVYSDEQIYQEVVNESLVLIEKSAHNCAINEIQQYYTETTGNQKTFVDKIVGLVMKELKTKINKSSVLPQGILTGYFGTALIAKVHILVDKEIKKEASRIERLNAKSNCPTCSLQFDTTTHRKITLNCGHNICLICLKDLWKKMGSATSCTKCNAKINISEHVHGVWITPSSDYDYNYDYNYTNYNTIPDASANYYY